MCTHFLVPLFSLVLAPLSPLIYPPRSSVPNTLPLARLEERPFRLEHDVAHLLQLRNAASCVQALGKVLMKSLSASKVLLRPILQVC